MESTRSPTQPGLQLPPEEQEHSIPRPLRSARAKLQGIRVQSLRTRDSMGTQGGRNGKFHTETHGEGRQGNGLQTTGLILMKLEWTAWLAVWSDGPLLPAPNLDLAPFYRSCPVRAGFAAWEDRLCLWVELSSSPWDKRADVPGTVHLLSPSGSIPDALSRALFSSSTCSQDVLLPFLVPSGLPVQLCHWLLYNLRFFFIYKMEIRTATSQDDPTHLLNKYMNINHILQP